MNTNSLNTLPVTYARISGFAYLVIIIILLVVAFERA